MLNTVASTIEANKTSKAATDLPALLKAHADLAATTSQIADLLETVATPAGPSPESSVKTTLAIDAIESCAELAAAVQAYAADNGETELAAQSGFSESALAGGKESNIVAKCGKVVALAAEVAEELDDYGYSPTDVTAIGKTVEAYAKACPKPRLGVASRSAANKEITRLVRKGRRIVTARIDKLMLQLRKTAPAFYNAYKTARKVVNLAKPQAKDVHAGTTEAKKAA